MERDEVVRLCDREVLEPAARLFGTRKEDLRLFAGYEGSANLVYEYARGGQALILRVSYRNERSAELIRAELDFVNYLGEHAVRVSRPVLSANGNLVETFHAGGTFFHVVSFVKGKGLRVPDNGYRYRTDAPIEEYFQNWGRMLGRMHALAREYQPAAGAPRRPDWFELNRDRLAIEALVPERFALVRRRIRSLLEEIAALPRDRDGFGLIHADFNDGNFTVDYSNGDITVFDFDDSCYFWFAYELASAWEGGIGRVMHRGLEERKAFMDRYMREVMTGYREENSPPADWLARLPLFTKLIQVEELLHYIRYIDTADQELLGELDYRIKCIEDDLPYKGFFDAIYSPERPFSL